MKVCILANSSRYIWNFRINLIEAIRSAGHDVISLSPRGPEASLIEDRGIQHISVELDPQGTNPFAEAKTILALRRILNLNAVDVVLSSTPKGNIYAALATHRSRIKQIANVSGLGTAYLRQDLVTRIVDFLYRASFRRIEQVFFENPSDCAEFLRRGWVDRDHIDVIPGLGVDLEHFRPQAYPPHASGELRFLMIARLIGDKGVREYVKAAKIVRQRYSSVRFALLGDKNPDNPTAICEEELKRWISERVIDYHEHTMDVRPHIADAHCIVLPSYREGMSRTLLEAAAMGRPLIATDVPGCREAVEDGINGFLCQPRSEDSLAEQMFRFLRLSEDEKYRMGAASRNKISSEFDEKIVIGRYLSVLNRLQAKV